MSYFQKLQQLREESNSRGVPNVTFENGMFLYMLVRILKPKNMLEIGSANAVSTLFFAKAFQENGIQKAVYGLEPQLEMFEEGMRYIEDFEMTEYCTLIHGTAADWFGELGDDPVGKVSYDFVFIDGRKKEYLEYFLQSQKFTHPETVFVFDDVVKFQHKMEDLYSHIREQELEHVIVPTDEDDGIMIVLPHTLKGFPLC